MIAQPHSNLSCPCIFSLVASISSRALRGPTRSINRVNDPVIHRSLIKEGMWEFLTAITNLKAK